MIEGYRQERMSDKRSNVVNPNDPKWRCQKSNFVHKTFFHKNKKSLKVFLEEMERPFMNLNEA